MPSTTHLALALLSLLTCTSAFVPIQALPSDLDTNLWIPIATYTPSPSLVERQGAVVTAPAAAQPPSVAAGQVSPVTTYQMHEYVNGVDHAVNVIYTQTFPAIPDQWPGPVAGNIGLGTIQGQVGVVRTKRSLPEPTQEVMGGDAMVWVESTTTAFLDMAEPTQPARVEVVEVYRGTSGRVPCPEAGEVSAAGRRIVAEWVAVVAASVMARLVWL